MRMAELNNPNCFSCHVYQCPIAQHCSNDWRQETNAFKTSSDYAKGQLIIKEETEAFGIHIIYSGKAIVTSDRNNNRRQIIRLAKEGDILEFSQESNTLTHPFSVEAIDKCRICYIPKMMLFRVLQHDTQLAFHLERRYSNRFIEAEKRLKYAMIMNGKAKVSEALLVIADAFDGKIPLLRREIGEMIGISAEQVSRELKRLAIEDIIEFSAKNNEVIIKDKNGLLEIVSSYDA